MARSRRPRAAWPGPGWASTSSASAAVRAGLGRRRSTLGSSISDAGLYSTCRPGGPFEERPDRQQPLGLRPEAQRVRRLRSAVVEQVTLVGLQHRAGHLDRAGHAALTEPGGEQGEHRPAGCAIVRGEQPPGAHVLQNSSTNAGNPAGRWGRLGSERPMLARRPITDHPHQHRAQTGLAKIHAIHRTGDVGGQGIGEQDILTRATMRVTIPAADRGCDYDCRSRPARVALPGTGAGPSAQICPSACTDEASGAPRPPPDHPPTGGRPDPDREAPRPDRDPS